MCEVGMETQKPHLIGVTCHMVLCYSFVSVIFVFFWLPGMSSRLTFRTVFFKYAANVQKIVYMCKFIFFFYIFLPIYMLFFRQLVTI